MLVLISNINSQQMLKCFEDDDNNYLLSLTININLMYFQSLQYFVVLSPPSHSSIIFIIRKLPHLLKENDKYIHWEKYFH